MKWNIINKTKNKIFDQEKLIIEINNCLKLLEDINQLTEYKSTKYFLGCFINSKEFYSDQVQSEKDHGHIKKISNHIALFHSDFVLKGDNIIKNRFGMYGKLIPKVPENFNKKFLFKIRQKLIKWLQ